MLKISTIAWSLSLCLLLVFISAKVQAQLKAGFTVSADSGCTQLSDTFTNTTSGGTPPYNYLWDLGNTRFATSKNSTAVYVSGGKYNITLTVTDAKGKKDSMTKTITVLGSPRADYSATMKMCGYIYYHATIDTLSPTPIAKYTWVGQGDPGYGPLYKVGETGGFNS